MKLTEEKIYEIHVACSKLKDKKKIEGRMVHIDNSRFLDPKLQKPFVFLDHAQVCAIDEIGELINALTIMKEAIEKETGFIV